MRGAAATRMRQVGGFVALIVISISLVSCVVRPKEAPAIRTIQPMEAVESTSFDPQHYATRAADPENDGVHTVACLVCGWG